MTKLKSWLKIYVRGSCRHIRHISHVSSKVLQNTWIIRNTDCRKNQRKRIIELYFHLTFASQHQEKRFVLERKETESMKRCCLQQCRAKKCTEEDEIMKLIQRWRKIMKQKRTYRVQWRTLFRPNTNYRNHKEYFMDSSENFQIFKF